MALQQICEKIGAKISNVGAAVNGRPTSVDVDLVRRSDGFVPWRARSGVASLELFALSRIGVKEANRHLKAVSFRAERETSHSIARSPAGRPSLRLRDGSLRSP